MRRFRRRPSLPLAFAALAYALALAQSPGVVFTDTKIHLYIDPARFLRNVTSLWSQSPDLGHVWASQYGGYAWPMAPWFAAGDALGLPIWVVQRLWLGTILFLAAWGTIRLLDRLVSPQRGAVHAVAALIYAVNPFVTVYASRASITLLAYAALPWLLLAVHRGLRDPRGWRWPAIFALVLATAGGGVNAAATAWVLLGPLLLVCYDRWILREVRGAVWPFAWRTAALAALVNLWWLVPLLIAGRGAPNFLVFTEQPGTIWSTTTVPETLRLLGFWTSYVGVGFTERLIPYQSSAPAMLFLMPVVLAGLALPAAALGSLAWTRRQRYVPLFGLMLIAGVLVMVVAWPDGTTAREAITYLYYRVQALQPLRTTYKAGGLVALSLGVLCGQLVALLWSRRSRWWLAVGAVALVALAAWPLVSGRALERQLRIEMPGYWREVAKALDARPDDTRALLVPGQHFAAYRWGGTVDAVLPALTDHPVTTRWIVPFSDPRSIELQFAIDELITQERLVPGQLAPLLDLLGTGDVLVVADGDRALSGQMPSADAVRALRELGTPTATYGASSTVQPAAGSLDPPLRVPAIARYERPLRQGLVAVLPRARPTIVDGSASALTGLAAFGRLDPGRAIRYAADVADLRAQATAPGGASLVIADGNRRRAFVAARPRGNHGETIAADQTISADGTIVDPFGGTDSGAETVAELRGLRAATAPASPQVTQFPDRRPFAAVDGDPSTAWIADRFLAPAQHRLTVELGRPRDVGELRLLPYSDSRGVVEAVRVNGRRFTVRRGWNTLRVNLRGVSRIEVAIAAISEPRRASGGAGGVRELRIPGVAPATEWLRPPQVVERALDGADLRRADLSYLFERTRADVPRAQQRYVGERGAGELRDAQDAERVLRRTIAPPVQRTYRVRAWTSVAPRTSDARLDGLLGTVPSGGSAWGSSRFGGEARYRASRLFDGSATRPWIGQWIRGRPAWVAWRTTRPVSVRTFRLSPAQLRVRRPTRVRLTADGRSGFTLAVAADGTVRLPRALTGRSFRLTILDARFPAGTPPRLHRRRGVGVGELVVAGAPRAPRARGATVSLGCGSAAITAAGRTVHLGGEVARADLESGRPLLLTGCERISLPAGHVDVAGMAAPPLQTDRLLLTSPAPVPVARAAASGGGVLDPGTPANGARSHMQLAVSAPSWLVQGQSYDPGWRATCDGADLGRPVPIQGYANGWPLDHGCAVASFRYAPQRFATAAVIVSSVVALLLLLALVAGARRAPVPEPVSNRALPRSPARRHGPSLALALAAAIGIVFGFRAGLVALPLLVVLFRYAVSDRTLGVAIATLLGAGVPLVYVAVALFGPEESVGGNSTDYVTHRIAAHWLAVAALVLAAIVVVRGLRDARGGEPPG